MTQTMGPEGQTDLLRHLAFQRRHKVEDRLHYGQTNDTDNEFGSLSTTIFGRGAGAQSHSKTQWGLTPGGVCFNSTVEYVSGAHKIASTESRTQGAQKRNLDVAY